MNDATLAEATRPTAPAKGRKRAPKRSEDQQIRDLQQRIAALEERKTFKAFAGTKLGGKLRRAISNLKVVAKKSADRDLAAYCQQVSETLEGMVAQRAAPNADPAQAVEPALPGFD